MNKSSKHKGNWLKTSALAVVIACSGAGMAACGSGSYGGSGGNNQTPEIVDQIYAINYELSGGTNASSNPTTYTQSTTTITLATPTRTGYAFGGWYTDVNYTGDPITSLDFNRTGNIYLYAKWTATQYTITYDAQGGTVDSLTTTYTVEDQVNLLMPVRPNYNFGGWYENADFTGEPVTTISTWNARNITLYAKWTAKQYTITYNARGGAVNTSTMTYTVEDQVDLPTPERTYYDFAGWYENADFTGEPVTIFDTGCAKNVTLYAKWAAKQYTITYDAQGGAVSSPIMNYTVEDQIDLLTPVRTGYNFDGWYENADYTGTAVTVFDTSCAKNVTLYAKWTATQYTIVYDARGGTVGLTTTTYTVEDQVGLPTPERADYNFNGWYENADYTGTPVITFDTSCAKNITLYAKWVYDINLLAETFEFTTGIDGKIEITGIKDTTVTQIVIPDGVTSIGSSAFGNCSGLTEITLPDSVTSIGRYAFRNCSSLTSITIPDGVSSINDYTFEGCSGLTSIAIPDSVTSIGSFAFSGCSGLTSITIPDSVTSIATYAFSGCSNLTSITVPDSVTDIANWAFSGCSSLQSITLPFVGNGTATGCNVLFGAIFGNEKYTGGASTKQHKTSTQTITYYIPKTLTTVTVTGGKISTYSFENCSNLTNIIIGDGVISIDQGAFSSCYSIQSIVLPFVGESANAEHAASLFGHVFGGSSANSYAVTQFYEKTEQGKIVHKAANYYIPMSLTTVTITGGKIPYGAFANCKTLTNITLPDNVTSIGGYVFFGCTGLTSITIPDGVTSINDYAFRGCTGLTSITIPDGVTCIDEYAFYGCSGLTSITIPDTVTSIGEESFLDCNNLTNVYYLGTLSQFQSINGYDNLSNDKVLYYSTTQPTDTTYKYWHYDDDGNIVEW